MNETSRNLNTNSDINGSGESMLASEQPTINVYVVLVNFRGAWGVIVKRNNICENVINDLFNLRR